MSQAVSPLSLDRYELKYLIPLSLVGPISKHIEAYCEMDYYSEISSDHFYCINSLYLDSPNHFLFRSKEDSGNFRFNVRIRSYGESPRAPYFFEVKYKLGEFVKKKRAKISHPNWAEIAEFSLFPEDMDPASAGNLNDFHSVKLKYNLEPSILTQYRRKAYISNVDDYARITFDRDLRFQETTDWNVNPSESQMSHYDAPELFGNAGESVILELKCEKKVPLWFLDLIRKFDLMRSGFSKFGGSTSTLYTVPEYLTPGRLYR
jgi:hypothetical protein